MRRRHDKRIVRQDKLIVQEARNGDRARLDRLLAAGADINSVGDHGYSALLEATLLGHLQVVRWLLAHGADVNLTSTDGSSPLWWACCKGHVDIAELLLAAGAEVGAAREKDSKRGGVTSCQQVAESSGHSAIVDLLVARQRKAR